jgi:hypothetical protein
LLLVANGRLGYRVLRCLAALDDVGAVIVLGSRGESSWPTEGLSRSRFCSEFVRAEWGYDDPRTANQVNRIADRYSDLRVMAADLATNLFLSRFGKAISAETFGAPNASALGGLARKDAFSRFCAEAKLPHPRTTVAADLAELERILAARAHQLFVLKPVDGQGGTGVRFASSSHGWRDIDYRPIVVQDYVPGSDLCASAFCRAGRIEAFQAYRHICKQVLGWPVHIGMEFFDSPRLRDLVAAVAARTSLDGIVNFDARQTPAGEVLLIECNPRPWFTMQLAMLAGANLLRSCFDEQGLAGPAEPVKTTLPLFPGGLLNLGGGFPWTHVRHMAADSWYYLSADWVSRILRPARARSHIHD